MKTAVGRGITAMLAVILLAAPASAEFSILIYFGKQLTGKGSLHLKQGDTDLDFRGVRWKEQSFKNPVFYGVRASYWFDRMRGWGAALDFTHAKTILAEKDIVAVGGSHRGFPVDGREAVSDTIKRFELTHGLNLLTLNGLHRWFAAGRRGQSPPGPLQCYTALGAGFSIPHVEAHIGDQWTGRYQPAAGPVLNGMLGVDYDFTRVLSGVLEYKLSYSAVHALLNGGGFIDAKTFNHQFVSGLAGTIPHW